MNEAGRDFRNLGPERRALERLGKAGAVATLPELDPENTAEALGAELELPSEILALVAQSVAFVVDLPGEDSVATGLALAARGVRPVPLFNALPGLPPALVDVAAVQQALGAGTNALWRAKLPLDAVPAFLLDSLRGTSRRITVNDRAFFDNRSLSFSTDFPSGATLREHGIERIVLLRRWYLSVPGDLVPTLAAWHAAGLKIEIHDVAAERAPLSWAPPSLLWLYRLWFHTVGPLVLKRERSGSFGRLSRNWGYSAGG